MSATQRNCATCQKANCQMRGPEIWWCDDHEPRADTPAAAQEPAGAPISLRKHPHYFKDVSKLQTVDVYRVLELFGVTSPCLQHSIKKLLCAGLRGAKDQAKDVAEAIDTLQRWQEMRAEDVPADEKSCSNCARQSDGTCGDMACVDASRWMFRVEGGE
jgi:hypothetical protein